jgi:DNA polymerase elongation subunit (family B)
VAVLLDNAVHHDDLMITTAVSRDIHRYRVHTLAKAALLQLRDLGVTVEPGQSVRYLVMDEHCRDYRRRVCIAETAPGTETVDTGYYLRQLARCAESLLIPFGYTIEKLEKTFLE